MFSEGRTLRRRLFVLKLKFTYMAVGVHQLYETIYRFLRGEAVTQANSGSLEDQYVYSCFRPQEFPQLFILTLRIFKCQLMGTYFIKYAILIVKTIVAIRSYLTDVWYYLCMLIDIELGFFFSRTNDVFKIMPIYNRRS